MKSPADSESSAGDATEGPELAAFQSFMRHLPGAWWIKDAAGRYVDANGAVEGILGTERARLLGSTDFEFLPKAAAAALRAHDEHVLRTGQSLEVIEQLPSSNGQTRSWFSCKFLLPSGAARYTAGFAIEISQITEERRNAEGMLQQILDAISDMVLVKGPNSRLEWANAAFLTTYGMTNEQLKGLIDAPYSEPDLTQKYVQDDHYVFTSGRSLEIPEEPMVRHDGRVLTCHTVKSPIFDGAGNVSKTVAVIRDITERKRLELELGQAQKLESVGRLASGIAHEINTPIQFVGDQARFLRDTFQDLMTLCQEYRDFVAKCEQGGVSPEDVASVRRAEADADLEFVVENVPQAFDAIAEGTARVGNLVRAMKEFGHPDRGEKTATDLNRALENTVTISSNETKFVADVSLDLGVLPEVTCYPGELNQVFLNLLVNAAHSIAEAVADSARRGKITITTRHVDEHVIVSIGDTGMGIPEALRAKIFEAFFTTKGVGRGTGQGLAIARMIVVEKHQGTLTFESELGVGTTFHVKIPVNSPQPTS